MFEYSSQIKAITGLIHFEHYTEYIQIFTTMNDNMRAREFVYGHVQGSDLVWSRVRFGKRLVILMKLRVAFVIMRFSFSEMVWSPQSKRFVLSFRL
jgi:hypothetical protein